MTDPASTSPVSAPARALARFLALRERRWFRWTMDLVVLLALLTAIGAWQARHHLRGAPPEVALRTLDGAPASLASLRGKPAMVAFWAPWCGVCGAQSRNVGWAMRLAGERARVVSIATSFEDVAQVRAYVADHEVAYPVLLGGDDAVRAFRVDAYPTLYFLDAEGRITGSAAGYTTTAGMLARLLLTAR
jgi:thiol-disulfide isomerase/thioredoxin